MADNMNNDRKMKEIISDAVDRQLDKEPELTMTPEKLKKRMAARKVERIKRRARNAGVAAALIVGVGAAMIIGGDFDVGANKNPKEEIITEDGVVIEDGGYGSSDGEDNVWVITDWDEIKSAKAIFDDLLIPTYIPKEYTFEKLVVQSLGAGDMTYEYFYGNNKNETIEIEIFIQKENIITFKTENVKKTLSGKCGDIFIVDDDLKIATTQIEDGKTVYIWGNIVDDEICKIIDNLYY